MKSLFLSVFALLSTILYSQNLDKPKPKKNSNSNLVKLPSDSLQRKVIIHNTEKQNTDSLISAAIKETMVSIRKKGYID